VEYFGASSYLQGKFMDVYISFWTIDWEGRPWIVLDGDLIHKEEILCYQDLTFCHQLCSIGTFDERILLWFHWLELCFTKQ